jgi:dihydroxy-acid dehydratase
MWAGRRAQWRALGLTDDDLLKPKIGVVNSSSGLAICFSHLDGLAEVAMDAIRAAGGVPFEIPTAAPSDFVTSAGKRGAYVLPARDLIASDIEVQVEGAQLDGMLCLASCDKTTPGQLMAAGRLDVPTIVVPCGYQRGGTFEGRHCDIEDVFMRSTDVASGRISVDELAAMADGAITSPGVCPGMGTANSMHMAAEALGMALPGTTPIAAYGDRLGEVVRRAGTQIVTNVWADLRPRTIMSAGAFRNAAAVVLALAASHNCLKHLQAVAVEAEVGVDVYGLFAELADRVPLLAAIRPSGPYPIEDLEAAGGAATVLSRLAPLLDLDTRLVDGRSLGDALAEAADAGRADTGVVHSLSDPVSRRPTILVVRGSLIPAGGIVRVGGDDDRTMRFHGRARAFGSREEALDAIDAGRIERGDVMVLRGLGVRGAPGMAFSSSVVFSLRTAGLLPDVAVITEGQVSGLVNLGIVVCEASPEAADGGPLAYVRDGDQIAIDLDARSVDLLVSDDELAAREPWTNERRSERGWLGVYERTVGPVHAGACLAIDDRDLAERSRDG